MDYTFKLRKENCSYLQEFINELLCVYYLVTIRADGEYYYISLVTNDRVQIDSEGIKIIYKDTGTK